MAATAPLWFVNQFKNNVFFSAQQKGSRLRNFVRNETQNALMAFYDGLGATDVTELVSRHSDTQYTNSQHLRRAVIMRDFTWADLVDNADKIRTLNSMENSYAQAAMWAMGRRIDKTIIEAALGSALSGYDGGNPTSSTILPASQYIGSVSGSAFTNLNLETLIKVKSKFGINDVDDSERLHIAVSQKQIDGLLNDTKVTSSDYNTVKALVQGEIDTFMGFKFHRTQLLPVGGAGGFVATVNTSTGEVTFVSGNGNSARRAFAWAPSGIVLAMGQEPTAKIEEMPNKNYSTQVFLRSSFGAVRLEEEKVVAVLCNE